MRWVLAVWERMFVEKSRPLVPYMGKHDHQVPISFLDFYTSMNQGSLPKRMIS